MLYDEQSGHDALFEAIEIDVAKRTASIRFLAYPEPNAKIRVTIKIEFSDVTSLTTHVDMIRLSENRFAGTVSQWRIANEAGTSHFYLIEGYIAISANSAPVLLLQ